MTLSESGNDRDNLATKDLPELNCELSEIGEERVVLCEVIENQWPDVPPEAVRYLANNCPKPELMSPVIAELQLLLADDPNVLSDPNIMALLIDDCIFEVSQQKANEVEHFEADVLISDKTTNAALTEINTQTASLKGRAKLTAARNYLDNLDITETVRSELMEHFDQIETTLTSMSSIFTDVESQTEFERIVSTASFDLGASDIATAFEPILKQVETSDKFTVEQKFKLREIVTGSDAQNSLAETITDGNGRDVPRFTKNNKREFRKGVSGYVEGHGRQMIEARAGDRMVTKDVTGWSGEDVGFLIEATHMWNMYDSFGVTGFVEDVYKVDFSILGDGNAFDPIQITHLRQVLSLLTGSFEGYDGDIANLSEHKTLIQNQSRLLSETQTALGLENNRSSTTKVLCRLGLEDEKGKPNMEVIKSFGDYTKQYYGNGVPDQLQLVKYLHHLHPDLVKPLSEAEKATGRLASVREV